MSCFSRPENLKHNKRLITINTDSSKAFPGGKFLLPRGANRY